MVAAPRLENILKYDTKAYLSSPDYLITFYQSLNFYILWILIIIETFTFFNHVLRIYCTFSKNNSLKQIKLMCHYLNLNCSQK